MLVQTWHVQVGCSRVHGWEINQKVRSVLQCVLQCVALCCSVLRGVLLCLACMAGKFITRCAVCCSVLQRVAVCCSDRNTHTHTHFTRHETSQCSRTAGSNAHSLPHPCKRHVAHINESCHTCQWVMSIIRAVPIRIPNRNRNRFWTSHTQCITIVTVTKFGICDLSHTL